MRMRGQLTQSQLENSAGGKADRLHEEIQSRLEVERRLWEQGVAEGNFETESDSEDQEEAFDMTTVDAILGHAEDFASK